MSQKTTFSRVGEELAAFGSLATAFHWSLFNLSPFTNHFPFFLPLLSTSETSPPTSISSRVDHKNSDFVVWESGAILNYLSNKYDSEGKFGGKSAEEKAVIDQWLFLQMTGLGPSQGLV